MQNQNTEENQVDTVEEFVMVPAIEENIPLPFTATEALPELTTQEELEMMVRTIKLCSDLTGQPIEPTQEDLQESKTLAETVVKHPKEKLQLRKYKNTVLAGLAGMVETLNAPLVDDLAELKNFVVNGLVREAATAEKSKERITALRAIGEVEGVNAFKKHVEVVHNNVSMDEIEDKLKRLVDKIQKRVLEKPTEVIDVEATEVKRDE